MICSFYSFSQEENRDWINLINIEDYKVYKKTSKLSKEFLRKIRTERKDIANANGKFSKGCTGSGKHIRLNWLAIDENEHQIISMSYGGVAYYTKYYIIDYETGKMNLRLIRVVSSNRELNLKQVINSINKSKYEWINQ